MDAEDMSDEITVDESVSPAVTEGTPDGHGYAGTVNVLGNAGTDGTDGSSTVGTGGTAGTEGTEGRAAVTVCCAMTFPRESTVAITSTGTVRIFSGFACRRWNMRCPLPMTSRPRCSRTNRGSSASSTKSSSSCFLSSASRSCTVSSLGETSWATWRYRWSTRIILDGMGALSMR